jgi:hypothetical protein
MSTVRSLPVASSSQVLSKWVPKLLTIYLLSILSLLPLHGQTLAGMNGTVTDSSGAVVPDAAVSATNNATGVTKQTHTGTTGTYILTDLIPGIYTVKVEKPSFKTSVNNAVTVEAGTKASFNAVLQAGTVSESVEVTTSAISLQTEQPQLGTTIENKQVQELPFELGGGLGGVGARGRQIDQYIFLAPGVTGGAFSHRIDGGVDFQNEVVFNGIPAVQSETQGFQSNINPPFEMVNEFRVLTNTFSAQYGLAQGVAYYQFASGTNALHGDAFEILRNDYFDAKPVTSPDKTPVDKEHNFGFSLGGPVFIPKLYNGKDKTFFHVSVEWYRLNQAITTPISVPTAAMKAGDFSAFPQPIFVPSAWATNPSLIPAGCVPGAAPGAQFPGNKIPPSCFSSLASSLLPSVPDPTGPGFTRNLPSQLTSIPTRNTLGGFSIDHNLTQRQALHVSYWRNSYSTFAEDNSAAFNNVLSDLKSEPRLGTGVFVTYSNTITNHLVMTAGFGWMGELNNEFNVHGQNSFAGVQAGTILPTINFGSDTSAKRGGDALAPSSWGVNANGETFSINRKLGLSFSNNWLYTHGRHTFNFGMDIRRSYQDDHECQNCGGGFTFSSHSTSDGSNLDTTGSSFASFLLGQVDSASRTFALNTKLRNKYFAPYVQDDIKITPRLTVNVGIRWDIAVPFTVTPFTGQPKETIVFFNPSVPNPGAISTITGQPLPGAASLLGTCAACVGYDRADVHWREFSPRLGFTYALTPKTVVLGGYSLNHLDGGAFEYGNNKVANNYGNVLSGVFNVSASGTATPAGGLWDINPIPNPPATPFTPTVLNPVNGGGGQGINEFSRNTGRLPYVQQWNAGIQRELPYNMFLSIAYLGNRGIHLPSLLNLSNAVNPGFLSAFGSILGDDWDAATSQAAMQSLGYGLTTTCSPGLFAPYATFGCDNPLGSTNLAQALRPFPHYGTITPNFDTAGVSLYNALQVQAQKRFTNGLSYLVTYTLSKNMTNTDSGFSTFNGSALNPYDQNAEWALASNDQKHLVNISAVYELPIGPGKKFANGNSTLNRVLLGGWQLSGVASYGSGTPFGIGRDASPLLAGGNRANIVAGQPVSVNWNNYKAEAAAAVANPSVGFAAGPPIFNTAAFSDPGRWAIGTSPRNIGSLRNPWLMSENIALAKHLRFTERMDAELRMEFYNIFNRFRICGGPNDLFSNNLSQDVASTSSFGFENGVCQGNNPRQGQATFVFRF